MAEPTQIGAEAVEAVELCCTERFRKFEESVRRSPGGYVLGAAALGYLLQFLPVGCLLKAAARIIFAALRPALLILGIVKLIECSREKCAAARAAEAARREEREPLMDSPAGPGA